jgi:hypothetical protein
MGIRLQGVGDAVENRGLSSCPTNATNQLFFNDITCVSRGLQAAGIHRLSGQLWIGVISGLIVLQEKRLVMREYRSSLNLTLPKRDPC